MLAPRSSRLASQLSLALLPMIVACSSSAGQSTATPAGAKARGSVTVFAAASLTEPFSDEQTTLKRSDPDLVITYDFAGSGALVAQIQQGAPADVVATADLVSMKKLSDAGLVETPVTFATNALEILVAPGNPLRIGSLADLARSDVKLVLEDESVPAGTYAAQVLSSAGVSVNPVSKEADVKSAVAKVTTGEADAAIVYVTDVASAGSKGQGVMLPDAQNVRAQYPIAVVKATKNHDGATAFLEAIVKGSGQDALAKRGFGPAG